MLIRDFNCGSRLTNSRIKLVNSSCVFLERISCIDSSLSKEFFFTNLFTPPLINFNKSAAACLQLKSHGQEHSQTTSPLKSIETLTLYLSFPKTVPVKVLSSMISIFFTRPSSKYSSPLSNISLPNSCSISSIFISFRNSIFIFFLLDKKKLFYEYLKFYMANQALELFQRISNNALQLTSQSSEAERGCWAGEKKIKNT